MKLIDSSPLSRTEILEVLEKHAPLADQPAEPEGAEQDEGDLAEGGLTTGPGDGPDQSAAKYVLKSTPKGAKSSLPRQVVFHGCPGSGKSYQVKEWTAFVDKVVDVVFHPELNYSDFVGVYRPYPVYKSAIGEFRTATGKPFELGEPYVTYQFVPGPFVDAYCFASRNPHHTVALVIEELSRANASLVFGDMLQLLDRVDDGENAGKSVYTVRPRPEVMEYLERHGVSDSDALRLPPNLFIWATMNRSDQNARQLDSAFLRRWEKRYLSHLTSCSYGSHMVDTPVGSVSWDELRSRINVELLNEHVPEDKFIGPYFLRPSSLKSKEKVADDLLGYLWNDVLRTRARDFFRPDLGSLAAVINEWVSGTENPFVKVKLP